MDIDVVILSKTSTEKLFDILRETVTSLHNSETDFKFNVIIVESNKKIKFGFVFKKENLRLPFGETSRPDALLQNFQQAICAC